MKGDIAKDFVKEICGGSRYFYSPKIWCGVQFYLPAESETCKSITQEEVKIGSIATGQS